MARRVISVCVLLAMAVSARAEVHVWAMNGMERIDPLNTTTGQAAVKLAAARNEYEPFQIAVQTGGKRATVNDVLVDDLVGEGGRKISSRNATRYREHCVYLRRPSPTSTARIGLYADALVPFVNPIDGSTIAEWRETNPKGAKYDAVPRHVYPGFAETFWIDLYVPPDAEPGNYRGQVRVIPAGLSPVIVPVELHVWAFTLPETPAVRSHFGGFHRVAEAHGVKPGSPEARVIEERYLAAMADHRITPDVPRDLLPVARPDGSIDPSSTHAKLAAFIKRYRVNAIAVPFGFTGDPAGKNRELTKKYLAAMQAYLAQHGWLDGAYIYIQDEPNSREEYEEVRRRAAVAHEGAPKISVLCTEQTKTSDPNWGDLYGDVDIWVPLWPLHDEPTALERLAAGEQLWSYTALCQCGDKPLFWQIDFPPLNYRVWAWINYRYQITGLLYWTTVYWGHVKDSWLDQPSFRLAYNGEGMLFYPGRDAGFDGPVASMRLKQIREGMEDYEYLHLLERKSGREKAQVYAQRIGRSWLDWEKDPAKLLEARAELARAIEATSR